MKVLIVSVNQEIEPYPVPPIGALYIAEALTVEGHAVRILDLSLVAENDVEIQRTINQFSPELIGLSIRNIDNTTYPSTKFYLPAIKEIVDIIRKSTTVPIVGGGSGFTILAEAIMTYLDLDYGIVGEGEAVMSVLCKRLAQKEPIDDLHFILDAKGEKGRTVRYKKESKFFIQRIPDRSMLNMQAYLQNGGLCNIQSKRGCAFTCVYCTYPFLEGCGLRMRSSESVMDELELLNQKYGINSFYFVDAVFNYPLSHAYSICESILKRGLNIKWTAFFHPKYLTDELVALLKRAGCEGIEVGADSLSDTVLDALKKGFYTRDVVKADEICRRQEMDSCCYILLGGPGETRDTIMETFHTLEDLGHTAIIVQSGIRIYPNTQLANIAQKEGYATEDFLRPRFYISRALENDMVSLIKQYMRSNKRIIYEGQGYSITTELLQRLRRSGVEGPLWKLKSS